MSLDQLTERIAIHDPVKSILNNEIGSISIKGLHGALKPLFLSLVQQTHRRPVLAVIPDREEAEALAEDLDAILSDASVAYYPGGAEDPESPVIVNPRRAGMQMRVVRDLTTGQLDVVVVSADGLMQQFPSPDTLKSAAVLIDPNAQHDLYALVDRLVHFGYTRESLVEKPGEISLRGGILDIFPFTGEPAHRIEFFGDQVDTIRTFNPSTQRSTGPSDRLTLFPAPVAWDDRSTTLPDLLPSNAICFMEDPDRLWGRADKLAGKEPVLLPSTDPLRASLSQFSIITHLTLSSPKGVIDAGGRDVRRLGVRSAEIREQLSSLSDLGREIILFTDDRHHGERIREFLDLDVEPVPGITVTSGPIRQGFDLPQAGLTVYTEAELFGRTVRSRRRIFRMGVPLRELSALKRGDYVVHVDHGIGVYQGLEKIVVKDVERECLLILYKDDGKLYVPVDKMERVQKYAGRDSGSPAISQLGSGRWERIKQKTKDAVKLAARDLIELYSARQSLPGYAFSPETPWQRELEATFPFDETRDQERAIHEMRADMEKARPMDRLVCGDVGYGKTEVAVRAAFKAVADGKQVAVLVPTTILAQQHFRTFCERLGRFPVNVEVLSRFRKPKTAREIVHKLKTGEVDVVIGTHRLLSKDVGFKDLGLLIIDEEQRFGVRHKERLKTYRKTVDVLTLSATPIPRTLHLSLMGIRDMSLISTPPKDRLPIITEVAPFNEGIIAEAVGREISRGGQVFFVHNRVRTIHAVARMVRRIAPGVRLGVAHGQMDVRDLEKAMMDFLEGRFDVLVSTMIIESGLDIPNVNTLIVHRADQLGLAQLYQLRGRVGRSDRRAYAYLLTPPFHLLTEDAIKRLRTIEEFTELGSGFQIAMRDLEIRGAGNLLGVEQSGAIDAVGFDLYNKLVGEAVHEIRSETEHADVKPPQSDCRVDVGLPALLPESYVSEENLRVNLYRRLALMDKTWEIRAFADELRDRFGPLPPETEILLDVARLRILGQRSGFSRIVLKKRSLQLFFNDTWADQFTTTDAISQRLESMVASAPVPTRFLSGSHFGLHMTVPDDDALGFAKKLLQTWA